VLELTLVKVSGDGFAYKQKALIGSRYENIDTSFNVFGMLSIEVSFIFQEEGITLNWKGSRHN
jgi:hypothetical protein